MKKMILVAGFLGMLFPSLASAQARGARQLINQSQSVHRDIRDSAQNLRPREIRRVRQLLQEIQSVLSDADVQQPTGYGPEASTTLSRITRKSGGQRYVLRLSQPTVLEAVQIERGFGDVRVYSVVAYTRQGTTEALRGLESYSDFVRRRESRVRSRNMVTEIAIVAESWGQRSSIEVTVQGRNGERPFTLR